VISMHQTPPGMVRGVSGVSRGRFYTTSTGSHAQRGGDEGVVLIFVWCLGGWLLNDRAVLLLKALHEGANLIVVFVRWL
jgi:hypothetical protein